MIFRKDIASNQEIQFDKAKMLDNYQQYEDDLNFKLKSVKYYYFTDQIFDNIKSADSSPIKIESMCISNNNDLHKLIHNNILTKLMFRQDKTYVAFTPMTYGLIIINVLIWLIMILYLNHFSDVKLLDLGGLVHFNVVHGEWYRLITSMFLHFNFEHILMNMLSLFIFGKIVESIVGPLRMLGIYVISGLLGNFISLSFNLHTVSVGASGAIFGLIGSIFAMMFVSKTYSKNNWTNVNRIISANCFIIIYV